MNDALNEAKGIYCICKQGNDNFNNVVIIVEYYGDDLFGDGSAPISVILQKDRLWVWNYYARKNDGVGLLKRTN